MERFRLYNVYPLMYDSFAEIAGEPERVSDLGFNGVWVNPMFETSSTPSSLTGKSDSAYGHKSFRLNTRYRNNPDQGAADDALQMTAFTDECRRYGLHSFMDVVLLHVAHDHALVTNDHDSFQSCEILKNIPDDLDTSRWFLDEANAMGDDIWDDVVPFNFDDEEIKREILDYYLRPYVKYIIEGWGFDALRIDSAPYIKPDVYHELMAYANEVCNERHDRDALFFPETVGQMPYEDIKALSDHADICYSSAHWFLTGHFAQWSIDGMDHSVALKEPFLGSKHIMDTAEKKRVVLNHYASVLHDDHGFLPSSTGRLKDEVAPVCGFIDNHDTVCTTDVFERMGFSNGENAELTRLTMAITAFLHDGWFLTTGSEYKKRSNSVFHASSADISHDIDNEEFVRQVNETLKALPDIRAEWRQAYLDPENPDFLFVVLRHGEGFDNTPDVIVVNTGNPYALLTKDMIDNALQNTVDRHGHPEAHDAQTPHNVYLCGPLLIGPAAYCTHKLYCNGVEMDPMSDDASFEALQTLALVDDDEPTPQP